MASSKWSRNTGKPYIRKANGTEKAGTFRDALRLAAFQEMHGRRGFYVMIQRRTGPEVMAVGRTKAEIVESLLAASDGFNNWADRLKRHCQGKPMFTKRQEESRRRRWALKEVSHD